jgi:archaellum biogenesis ATPase FlaH
MRNRVCDKLREVQKEVSKTVLKQNANSWETKGVIWQVSSDDRALTKLAWEDKMLRANVYIYTLAL